jgi:hypothetical protein
MRWRRCPFLVTTSYAEHFNLVAVHAQKLDFHDDCVRLTAVWRIRRIRMEETAPRYVWRVATKTLNNRPSSVGLIGELTTSHL